MFPVRTRVSIVQHCANCLYSAKFPPEGDWTLNTSKSRNIRWGPCHLRMLSEFSLCLTEILQWLSVRIVSSCKRFSIFFTETDIRIKS